MKSGEDRYAELLARPGDLQRHIMMTLQAQMHPQLAITSTTPLLASGKGYQNDIRDMQQAMSSAKQHLDATASSVLLLLAPEAHGPEAPPEVSLILTKRSRRVRQAGDLCCPGGTVEPRLDRILAKLLRLPHSPLSRWPYWPALRALEPTAARQLAFMFATGLRESWEEMRLNPLRLRFLGVLPQERLVLFPRIIYPLVAWVGRQKRFFPSWEVDRIVSIPLRDLLNPSNYCRYRLYVEPHLVSRYRQEVQDYPCVFHRDQNQTEILWGVTYRIVTQFLEQVFGYSAPDVTSRPFIPGLLDDGYLNGRT
jgi:hypothetical protein